MKTKKGVQAIRGTGPKVKLLIQEHIEALQASRQHHKSFLRLDKTNPKDLIGMTKPPVGLVPPALIIHVSQAMKNGAIKYGPYNWRSNKVRMSIYLDAALRHILELLDGEDFASDSGVHHAAHAAACMGIILDALETGSLVDDRPHKGAASKLIARFTSQKHISHMQAAQPSNENSH